MNLDLIIFNAINQFAGKWVVLDALGIFFAKYFEYFLIAGILIYLAFNFKKSWKIIFTAFGVAIISRFAVAQIIRWIWFRPRPFINNHVNLLINHANEASFPSGHASFYFALAMVIYFYNKKAGIYFFVAAFLISLGRVFTGIHWSSDILAGAIVGILCGWLVAKIFVKIKESSN